MIEAVRQRAQDLHVALGRRRVHLRRSTASDAPVNLEPRVPHRDLLADPDVLRPGRPAGNDEIAAKADGVDRLGGDAFEVAHAFEIDDRDPGLGHVGEHEAGGLDEPDPAARLLPHEGGEELLDQGAAERGRGIALDHLATVAVDRQRAGLRIEAAFELGQTRIAHQGEEVRFGPPFGRARIEPRTAMGEREAPVVRHTRAGGERDRVEPVGREAFHGVAANFLQRGGHGGYSGPMGAVLRARSYAPGSRAS